MYLLFRYKYISFERLGQEILRAAETEKEKRKHLFEIDQKQKELTLKQHFDQLYEQRNHKLELREERLDRQLALLDKKLHEVEKKEKEITRGWHNSRLKESQAIALETRCLSELEKISGMNCEEAKEHLVNQVKQEIASELTAFLMKRKAEVEAEAESHARAVLATAIHRLSLASIHDAVVSVVTLPNHDIKGRIIGREGRNIRILEETTGVNIIMDDTPHAILISSFDPLRKEVAKIAIKELIQDGRIHPTRIEEVVKKAQEEVHRHVLQYGKDAALSAGALSFHPELIELLGKLHFCYHQAQNVLVHSLEVCHLMGIMAAEMGLDCELAKRIGLLHDIGKAISHEMEGSHALIGQQLAIKYGESLAVANGIASHHGEVQPQTVEAVLCAAANNMSAERPGARCEALEHYFKRAAKLEALTHQFDGVERAYALQAGKEIRVIVKPEKFDDSTLLLLARDIAKRIEKEISYQGNIKVTVIREMKAIEYAS